MEIFQSLIANVTAGLIVKWAVQMVEQRNKR